MKTTFSNGWYMLRNGYYGLCSLFNADGTLVAAGLLDCWVCKNGLYALKKWNDTWCVSFWELHEADGTLIAKELRGFCECNNGFFAVKIWSGWMLYKADRTLIAEDLLDFWIYDNGWYALETADRWRLYKADGTCVAKNLPCLPYPSEICEWETLGKSIF